MKITHHAVKIGVIFFLSFLVFYNLPSFPLTWFDEGSHLHVPKTIVKYGEYADYSSEGFRYYGPTIGMGPTVMLPIAGVFSIFGIGLLQARLVMAIYLLATVWVFYRFATCFGDWKFALLTLAFLISSRSILLIETGRQVLGEVPGLFFIVAGLAVWYKDWDNPTLKRLLAAGFLLGLAIITKYQYLLFLAPALFIAWIANVLYYRAAPQRAFIIPGAIAAATFALWQAYLLLYLGPATISENFALLRNSAANAAFNFVPELIDQNLNTLISRAAFMGALAPALIYGFFLVLPRQEKGIKWLLPYLFVAINLGWYVAFSIGWLRYALVGFAFSTLFVARFVMDLTDGLQFKIGSIFRKSVQRETLGRDLILPVAIGLWSAAIILLPFAKTFKDIVLPPPNTPVMAAEYIKQNIPQDALIETWEPELGFLTDHNYHFPPTESLAKAVDYVYLGGPPVSEFYDYYKSNPPDYFVIGEFSAWVGVYDWDFLNAHYELMTQIGDYLVYAKKP